MLPAKDESVNFDETENVIIEGDNLEALKLLQKSYLGKIKMIYIDPPYNTGNDFIYPDDYTESLDTYLKYTGQVDDEGRRFSTNTDTDGRFHSKWLNMMYPRLFLARNLLREDGVIFISIDDREVDNLKKICNEIFGEENFVRNIVWQKKYASANDAKGIPDMHDHILVYQKSDFFCRQLLPRTDKQDCLYKYDDNDERGKWRSDNLSVKSYSPEYDYPITNPLTGVKYNPPRGRCWLTNKQVMATWIEEKRVFFGHDGKGAPQLKRYLAEVQQGIVPTSWWGYEECGHNDESRKEIKKLFEPDDPPFDTPKPTRLIVKMLQVGSIVDHDSVILDFFAGSGTTAHAVLDLNKQDGGNRKFILVQLPEPTDRKDYLTIADICKERVRRVIRKLDDEEKEASKQSQLNFGGTALAVKQDRGFKVFKLNSSNFRSWNTDLKKDVHKLQAELKLHASHIQQGRKQEDILYEILLKSGFELSAKVEKLKLAGKTVFSVAEGMLLICLEKELTKNALKEMAEKRPKRVVCLDQCFGGNDQLKTNAVETMRAKDIEFKTV